MDNLEESENKRRRIEISHLAVGKYCLTKLIDKKLHFYVAEVKQNK